MPAQRSVPHQGLGGAQNDHSRAQRAPRQPTGCNAHNGGDARGCCRRLDHAPSLGVIRPALLLVSFQPLTDLECGVHVELPVHALLPWPEVGGRLRHRDDLGPVDIVRVPVVTMVAEPLSRTFFSQSVRLPYGRAIKKLSSCWAATTGVSYVRPDRRPTWRTIDVLDPSLPADLRASGRMARVNKRKAFWREPLMPQRSRERGLMSRAEGPTVART
jgi:hypothetical protein